MCAGAMIEECDEFLKKFLGLGCNEISIMLLARDFDYRKNLTYSTAAFTYMEGDRAMLTHYWDTEEFVVHAGNKIRLCTPSCALRVFTFLSGCTLEL